MVLFTSFQRSNSNNNQSMCFQTLDPKHVASTPSASTSSRCTWIMTMNMVVMTSQCKNTALLHSFFFGWLVLSIRSVLRVMLSFSEISNCVFQQVYLQLHLHLLKIPFLYIHYTHTTIHIHHTHILYPYHIHTTHIPHTHTSLLKQIMQSIA